MKLKQVIDLVDGIEPNAYTNDVKTAWMNEVEGMVQTDVMLRAIEDIDQYTWTDDQQTVLLVKPPHDKLYRFYLQAMIQFANGEYDRYSNTMTVFNGAYGEFVRWFSRTVYPAGREAVWRGYYLSAYGIAVAHGYSGTEEEWLATLKGEQGDAVELRYHDEALEWKYAPDESWNELLDLTDLRTQVENDTIANVNAAKSAAQSSATAASGSAATAVLSALEAAGSASAAQAAQSAAVTAQTAAETAQEAAETAQTGAEAAQTGAEAAQSAAETAQTAAEAAQTAAEAAESGAEAAADDVSEMVDRMGNVPVVSGTVYTATNTGVTETLTKTNIKTGAETTETVPMPVANAQTAGLMTPEQVEAIEELESRVGGLENQNVRLSYTASGTPTAAEIRAFVLDAGYTDTTKWASIGVVVSATNNIWRYYANTATWTDIGLDTVQQASSSVKGIVQGSSTNGKVFVEADGTMSLNGYDALTTDISTLQSEKYEKPGTGIPETDLTSAVQTKLNAKGIQWATYGSTSALQIFNWMYSGYAVYLKKTNGPGTTVYTLRAHRANSQYSSTQGYLYSAKFVSENAEASVNAQGMWTFTTFSDKWERTGNKVTSLSASSTDVQYPSAKAVYDAISGQQTFTMQIHYTDGTTKTATIKGAVT